MPVGQAMAGATVPASNKRIHHFVTPTRYMGRLRSSGEVIELSPTEAAELGGLVKPGKIRVPRAPGQPRFDGYYRVTRKAGSVRIRMSADSPSEIFTHPSVIELTAAQAEDLGDAVESVEEDVYEEEFDSEDEPDEDEPDEDEPEDEVID